MAEIVHLRPGMRMDDQGIWVRLVEMECRFATNLGFERDAEVQRNDRHDAHGLEGDGDSLFRHINGAGGEIAVAKWRGIYFLPTINTFKSPDIGKNIQVRTRSRHDWDLLVRPEAKDHEIYICVTGRLPDYCLRGWLWAHEAKRPEYWKNHGQRGPAWFVPTINLRRLPLVPKPIGDPLQDILRKA